MTTAVGFAEMFSSVPHSSLIAPAGEMDGTINPASLNPGTLNPAVLSTPVQTPATLAQPSVTTPRGVKRSRSPETPGYREGGFGDPLSAGAPEEPIKRRRGRPPKNKSGSVTSTPIQQPQQLPVQTPNQLDLLASPPQQVVGIVSQAALPKATPPKAVVKALPTVRDHTTDQLTQEGDEYIPREYDQDGEKKVQPNGELTGKRVYKCRIFHVPGRGDKLFMLATECARVLGYRDSYLLFNKNRSLYKIIATQAEKDDLINQGLLPYSYRSRQIAIVTAKSMFRQFGSRVIEGGRRVRDDYWEMKAKKQGFTEEDPAGEKRPGAAKQRLAQQESDRAQAAAAAAAAQQGGGQPGQPPSHSIGGHDHITYPDPTLPLDTQPQMVQPGMPIVSAPLPMISLPAKDDRMKEILTVPRPRQEVTGPPYRDNIRPTPPAQALEQAQQTAEYNKSLGQQRSIRSESYQGYWKKSPPLTQLSPTLLPGQPLPSPQHSSPPLLPNSGPPMSHLGGGSLPMMNPQQLSNLNHQPGHHLSQQSPVRMPQSIKPEQLHNHNQGYMPQGGYYSAQPQTHPGHPQQMHPSQHQMMHSQQQHMYASPSAYMQQPPPQQNFRQQPHPQAGGQQWWSGA